jgi:hypothetical protein
MITTLNNSCDQMRKHIVSAKSTSAPMLEEASTLIAGKQESETKQAVLTAFTKHFIVADEELNVLTSSAVPVNEQFFVILNRVKKIHNDCEPLLGSENERLGMEIMEQTSRNLDAGFKKLYNWVQRALKGLDFEDPKISGSIRRALRVLSERPSMFQKCLEVLADAREQTLSDAFQTALSGAGDGSGSAIEFSAHDLLRYMGDMLAWVHSTTVSEKESLEGLFIADADAINRGMQLGKVSEPWLQEFGPVGLSNDDPEIQQPSFDGQKALKDLVSRSLTTITSTLQQRVELAIHQHDDIILLFKGQNLLSFYHALFVKLLSPTSALTRTIESLISTTQSHLQHSLDSDTSTSWPTDPTAGSSSHKANLRTLTALATIMPPTSWSPAQLSFFLTHYLSPTLDFASRVALAEKSPQSSHPRFTDIDLMTAIGYMAANITWLSAYAANLAATAPFADRSLKTTLEDALVRRVYTSMMEASGVGALIEELDASIDTNTGTTTDPPSDPTTLLTTLPEYAAQLDDFLADGYAEIVGRVNEKQHAYEHEIANTEKENRRSIAQDAKQRFLVEVSHVLAKLEELGEEYTEAYPRTMEDVEVLLG